MDSSADFCIWWTPRGLNSVGVRGGIRGEVRSGVRRTFKKVGGGPVRLSVQGGPASESGGLKSTWSQADLWN